MTLEEVRKTEDLKKLPKYIKYDNGVFKGRGEIVGVATSPLYGLGMQLIVKDDSGRFPNSEYPYSTLIVAQNQITDFQN